MPPSKKKKMGLKYKNLYVTALIFLLVFALSAYVLSGLFAAPTPSNEDTSTSQDTSEGTSVSQGMKKFGTACISSTGDFKGRKTLPHQGNMELIKCDNKNLATDVGLNATRDLFTKGGIAFTFIGLCNSTQTSSTSGVECAVPAATDIVLGNATTNNEYDSCGLSRKNGTFFFNEATPGNWSINVTFTATCDGIATNKTGLFNASTGNAMVAELRFPDLFLRSNDQAIITWTNYFESG